MRALDHLRGGGESLVANVGYGHGYSVRAVIDAVQRIEGEFPVRKEPRRAGDPPVVIADPGIARAALNWRYKFDDLDFIVRHALEWERRLGVRNLSD